jgi:acetyl-CoA C-acetyltransferase
MKLKTPVGIAAPRRTLMGRLGGSLSHLEAHELLAASLSDVAGHAPTDIDEVLVGCVRNSIGNIARVGALQAGLPIDLPAATIDRQCASSLEALALAAAKIGAGLSECVLVGGVESASRCPWFMEKTPRPYHYFEPQPFPIRMSTEEVGDPSMGETAEIVADEFHVTREQMDEFALQSQQRAAKADFSPELTPVPPGRGEAPTRDDSIRESTLEGLSKLKPVFRKDGRVTPGNSSPLSDGASACVAASLDVFEHAGQKPDAILHAINAVALEPKRMGMGPALAIPALLENCDLKQSDIDLFEINEAFAAQVLACNTQLKLPLDVLNVNGGAIALGHPFGATGVRLIATLVNALKQQGGKRGVASLCIGGGQGMAALIELP